MNLEPYLADLADSLAAAAAVGDDEARRTAGQLIAVLDPSARLALMNAMSDLAAEVTHMLNGPVVELRLDVRDVTVVVTPAEPADEPLPPAPLPPIDPSGETTRITLRLPEALKIGAEEAAGRQGVSMNTWLTQAVQGALFQDQQPRSGRSAGRVRGWVTG